MAIGTGTSPSDRLRWLRPLEAQQPLFAVVDASRDARVYPLLRSAGPLVGPLYAMPAARELATVAPYLAAVPPGSSVARDLLAGGWGAGWAVWLTGPADADVLLRHFRRLLAVRREDGRDVFFRFYDPRVLRRYLPTCNDEEAEAFFGPVGSFVVEGATPDACVRYTRGRGGVMAEALTPESLERKAADAAATSAARPIRPAEPTETISTATQTVAAAAAVAPPAIPLATGLAIVPPPIIARPLAPFRPLAPVSAGPSSATPIAARGGQAAEAEAAADAEATSVPGRVVPAAAGATGATGAAVAEEAASPDDGPASDEMPTLDVESAWVDHRVAEVEKRHAAVESTALSDTPGTPGAPETSDRAGGVAVSETLASDAGDDSEPVVFRNTPFSVTGVPPVPVSHESERAGNPDLSIRPPASTGETPVTLIGAFFEARGSIADPELGIELGAAVQEPPPQPSPGVPGEGVEAEPNSFPGACLVADLPYESDDSARAAFAGVAGAPNVSQDDADGLVELSPDSEIAAGREWIEESERTGTPVSANVRGAAGLGPFDDADDETAVPVLGAAPVVTDESPVAGLADHVSDVADLASADVGTSPIDERDESDGPAEPTEPARLVAAADAVPADGWPTDAEPDETAWRHVDGADWSETVPVLSSVPNGATAEPLDATGRAGVPPPAAGWDRSLSSSDSESESSPESVTDGPADRPDPIAPVDPWYDPDADVWDDELAPRPAWRWPPPATPP